MRTLKALTVELVTAGARARACLLISLLLLLATSASLRAQETVTTLGALSLSAGTGEKPQSKLW
jgi:hypothetical protein